MFTKKIEELQLDPVVGDKPKKKETKEQLNKWLRQDKEE
jgi:hypothetical protein